MTKEKNQKTLKIKQIIPAPELYVVYKDDDGIFLGSKVVCLALVEEKNQSGTFEYVSGIELAGEMGMEIPEESFNFHGYIRNPEEIYQLNGDNKKPALRLKT